jgi:hypothetical protein
MAYTILKKLGIPCSIWISETYGHSIVGVGLPVGAGSYKEINGMKHYATELTAKRFRLGMISPEQQNMSKLSTSKLALRLDLHSLLLIFY